MDKNLDKRTQSRLPIASAELPSMTQKAPNVAGSPADGFSPRREQTGLRFPPTRAARASRGRGVFLDESDEAMSGKRSRWIEVPVAIVALAVAAFAVTVWINAPSVVASSALGTNPGPAMVAAASVAPAFVLPARSR